MGLFDAFLGKRSFFFTAFPAIATVVAKSGLTFGRNSRLKSWFSNDQLAKDVGGATSFKYHLWPSINI